jgi:hypothetical protein
VLNHTWMLSYVSCVIEFTPLVFNYYVYPVTVFACICTKSMWSRLNGILIHIFVTANCAILLHTYADITTAEFTYHLNYLIFLCSCMIPDLEFHSICTNINTVGLRDKKISLKYFIYFKERISYDVNST